MKGIIAAGGTGSRLFPVTKGVNKHLLPVGGKPMIYYPIQTLVDAGIYEILIVTTPDGVGPLSKQLGSGDAFRREDGKQIQILYAIQNEPLGIAHTLRISQSFIGGESLALILGDNIIVDDVSDDILSFHQGAKVFLKEVEDPERFGIAEVHDGKVIGLEEKPSQPKSHLAVIGLYLYDNTVFDLVDTIQPSWRQELEITDVNKAYLEQGKLSYGILDGYREDAGTFASLHRADIYMHTH